jgi:arylsulfatase A-like enzyme
VLVVLLDAARSDHFGHLGYDRPSTPHIDELARASVVFEQAYAQASGTANSVYSFLTSRYPVFESVPKLVGQNAIFLGEEALTLVEAMGERHPHRLMLSINPFVREYLGFTQGATKVIEDWRPTADEGRGVPPRYAERVTGPGLSWMRQHAEDGFFAYLHYIEPHEPYLPPEPFLSRLARTPPNARYGRAKVLRQLGQRTPPPKVIDAVKDLYDGNLAWVDSQVGALVDSLHTEGILDRTVLVLISDHGEAFWEHGHRGHGHEPYEELVRIPFLIHVPTVGRSLVDVMLEGKGDPERLIHVRSNRTERPVYALRKGHWKWMFHVDAERQELYDLASDPGEQEDLVAAGTADPELLQEFGGLLRTWLSSGRSEQLNATPVDNQMLDESMIESLRSLGYIE